MRVLVLGGAGQLGTELARVNWPSSVTLQLRTRSELDISSEIELDQGVAPADFVVNAAAYTNVDGAESESERAYEINERAAGRLARVCARRGCPLLHVSTDYVFDGAKGEAYVEHDLVAPLNVYGASKAAGEAAVRESCENHLILRTSWLMGASGRNFLKTILRLASEKEHLRVVADQVGRPTPAQDLADVIRRIVERHWNGSPIVWGTYHFAAAGRASWYDVAQVIVDLQASVTGKRPRVEPITTADFPTRARRPPNSELDTTKLEAALQLRPEAWQRGVAAAVQRLLHGEDSLAG